MKPGPPKGRPRSKTMKRVIDWRKISAGSYELKLACGHVLKRAASEGVPEKAHCPVCEEQAKR